MVSNYAENGVEIQYHLPEVRDCHIDENQTQAPSHEGREVEASTPVRSNSGHMTNYGCAKYGLHVNNRY